MKKVCFKFTHLMSLYSLFSLDEAYPSQDKANDSFHWNFAHSDLIFEIQLNGQHHKVTTCPRMQQTGDPFGTTPPLWLELPRKV